MLNTLKIFCPILFDALYGLPHAGITTNFTKGEKITKTDLSPNIKTIIKSNYAYLIDYADFNTTKVLYQLLDNQILTKFSIKPLSVKISGTEIKFGYGTLVISVNSQKISTDELHQRLTKISQETGVKIEPVSTGFSASGIDLGSNSVVNVKKPQALMLIGGNVTSSEVGGSLAFVRY